MYLLPPTIKPKSRPFSIRLFLHLAVEPKMSWMVPRALRTWTWRDSNPRLAGITHTRN